MDAHQVEELICVVSAMDRQSLVEKFRNFRGDFPVDFTPEFLDAQPTDRLRHIFVALCIQHRRMPDWDMSTAA
jgi:hypothetical protein